MDKCTEYLHHQLNSLFILSEDEEHILKNWGATSLAYDKAIQALDGFVNKYFHGNIDPVNSVIWCNYLYWVSRLFYINGQEPLAEKVYYLNKTLNACDLFYAIELLEIWSCEYPVGTVMGRAKYGSRFFFYQGCTVGGNRKGDKIDYPVIGNDVLMYSNSSVIGKSRIGDNVTISANTCVINQDVSDNSLVFGSSPNLIIKEKGNM